MYSHPAIVAINKPPLLSLCERSEHKALLKLCKILIARIAGSHRNGYVCSLYSLFFDISKVQGFSSGSYPQFEGYGYFFLI
jgi:hypothetical protein